MKNHLIIGYGEVGQALHKVFPDASTYDYQMGSPNFDASWDFKVLPKIYAMHICFPYISESRFIEQVEEYQKKYRPYLTIIHSSVPIGTSDKLNAVHSPVRGVHPNLEAGLRTFVKYFGGFKAKEAAKLFEDVGIRTKVIRDARTTEAAKLWDTTQYGIMILLEKEIYKFCRDNGLDFEIVYADFNKTYNAGYEQLGMEHVVRPALMHKDGPIGGHCVIENAELLPSSISEFLLKANEGYKLATVPSNPAIKKNKSVDHHTCCRGCYCSCHSDQDGNDSSCTGGCCTPYSECPVCVEDEGRSTGKK